MAEFVRSLAAQGAAKCVIDTAVAESLLNGPVNISPRLADAEKELIVKMLAAMRERFGDEPEGELHADEVASLFTFVSAKAAEAVTDMYNKQPDKFELTGMFDGRIPIYADDRITNAFKASEFASKCAENYLKWVAENSSALAETDPLLLLFEALKWCFRLSCHHAVEIVGA